MTTVAILGASGMLGSMVVDVLSRDRALDVTATVRTEQLAAAGRRRLPHITWRLFDADNWDGSSAAPLVGQEWVINCIGITKQVIRDDDPADVARAIRINAMFPHRLGATIGSGGHVIQIATDCVFSGRSGGNTEADPHDPLDVYGKTKSLGETAQASVRHLRCSIIGPEPKDYRSLLEWFLRQPQGAHLRGFANHRWNGVTTLHFARVCHGVIKSDFNLPPLQHVVPTGVLTKAEMLRHFVQAYGRQDIQISNVETDETVDRSLGTLNPEANRALWRLAGYEDPPTLPGMIHELSQFNYLFRELAALDYRPR